MRHRKSGRHLSRTSAHRKAMFQNMAVSLFEHELIKTTLPKAKELRRVAEPLITPGQGRQRCQPPPGFRPYPFESCCRQAVQRSGQALRHPSGRLSAHPRAVSAQGTTHLWLTSSWLTVRSLVRLKPQPSNRPLYEEPGLGPVFMSERWCCSISLVRLIN